MTVDLNALRRELEAAEDDLASIRDAIGTTADLGAQVRLRKRETALLDTIAALKRAITAAEREAEAKAERDRLSLAADWRDRLYHQARAELDEAEAQTLSALRQAREAFERWRERYASWEALRRSCGPDCEPRLGRLPGSFSDFLRPSPLDPATRELRAILR